jgi:hypothetical protein
LQRNTADERFSTAPQRLLFHFYIKDDIEAARRRLRRSRRGVIEKADDDGQQR